jgi:DNA-binding transcriptional regulator PaaX
MFMPPANLLNFSKPRTVTQWLIFLAAAGIILSSPIGARSLLEELNKYIFDRDEWDKKNKSFKTTQLSQALYLLKKRKIINVRKSGGKTIVELTEKGKKRKLQYDLDNLIIPKREKWDKKWRFLMFDIPESKKSAREALREKLKELGFFQFQKSIWIYPYPCAEEIDFISEVFAVAPYINLLTVQLEEDEPLRLKFKL